MERSVLFIQEGVINCIRGGVETADEKQKAMSDREQADDDAQRSHQPRKQMRFGLVDDDVSNYGKRAPSVSVGEATIIPCSNGSLEGAWKRNREKMVLACRCFPTDDHSHY